MQLCSHHHHAAHEGGWTIVGNANSQLAFHGPDGRVALVAPTPINPRHPIEQQHTALGLTLDADTNASQWDHRPYDMDTRSARAVRRSPLISESHRRTSGPTRTWRRSDTPAARAPPDCPDLTVGPVAFGASTAADTFV